MMRPICWAEIPWPQRPPQSTYTLAELLAKFAPDWEPPQVGGEALVQTHCHQHAVLGFDADRALMAAAGIRAVVPDSGCCGLAGQLRVRARPLRGVEGGRRAGAAARRPRSAATTTAIVADGFSCRTQIEQGTPRRAVHLAELLAAALRQG